MSHLRSVMHRAHSVNTKLLASGWQQHASAARLSVSAVRRCPAGTAFSQSPPHLLNAFTEDPVLGKYLRRYIGADVYKAVSHELTVFGARCASDLLELAAACERNPPQLINYNAWGRRVDTLITCDAWREMKSVSAHEGLVAAAYEHKFGAFDRLFHMAKLMLFAPSSGLFSCPLAMTDGAASVLQGAKSEMLQDAFGRLTSRDPTRFWTAGQWMTEKKGGSDVSGGTETTAIAQPDGSFRLSGFKWFSSATDSDISLTLARIVDTDNPSASMLTQTQNVAALSMFFLKTHCADGCLNNIEIVRLKDKLGTRQLPTAELRLLGSRAHLVGQPGRGVASIAPMLSVTRLYNAVCSVGYMRRVLQLASSYSVKRRVFGRLLYQLPLHMHCLAVLEVATRGAQALCLETVSLLGRQERGVASETERARLRILTPVLKLFTGKQAVAIVSDALEAFGGQGYVESTGLPGILRDAQVLPIWEGTTNVLALDMLRAVRISEGACWRALLAHVHDTLLATRPQQHAHLPSLTAAKHKILREFEALDELFGSSRAAELGVLARDIAMTLAKAYTGGLLYWHCCQSDSTREDSVVVLRWCHQHLNGGAASAGASLDVAALSSSHQRDSLDLVMGGHEGELLDLS